MNRISRILALSVIAVSVVGGGVHAQEGGAASSMAETCAARLKGGPDGKFSVEDLNQVNDCLERLRLLSQIEATLTEINKAQQGRQPPREAKAEPASQPVVIQPPQIIQPPAQGYAVARVTGRDGDYTAVLLDAGGRWTAVKQGSSLGTDLQVTRIALDGVDVKDTRSGAARKLPFAAASGGGPVGSAQSGPFGPGYVPPGAAPSAPGS